MKELSKRFFIDIYSAGLELVICDDLNAAKSGKNRRINMKGLPSMDDARGMLVHGAPEFCILIKREYVCHEVIAHETFHATAFILDNASVKFSIDNHEAYTYLCGHLSELIYGQLKKWKIKIK